MRWYIAENKRKIATEDMSEHFDDIEMSGEKVSGIIRYGARDGKIETAIDLVFPSLRVQPNDTYGSYTLKGVKSPQLFAEQERFVRAEIDGVLTLYSRIKAGDIIRRFYPSETESVFYEEIDIIAREEVVPVWELSKRLETKIGCEGYIYAERKADKAPCRLAPGENETVLFSYAARYNGEKICEETNPLKKRRARIKELLEECDLTTGNTVIDTLFAFSKIRAGESLFKTRKGLIHSPGGYAYYAAIWCNDECEYAAPWFAYTGDRKAMEGCENMFRWFEPFMNDEYLPIPSSIIAEGTDYWNGAGDRGDAAMYLYGLSRFLLTCGKIPDEGQKKALDWCAEYIERKLNCDDVVVSDSDELENRVSSGINLATSALSYGGLRCLSALWKKTGEDKKSKKVTALASRIERGIENYFGADIKGWHTYRYHAGCEVIRAWNCLPVYMGIAERAEDTLDGIEGELWTEDGCRTTEEEKILWDRSTLYFLTTEFRAGKTERAWNKLKNYSARRLLGERIPYPVEAYPEGAMRHLSAESALFCRTITDGLLKLDAGERIYRNIPEELNFISLKKIYIDGQYCDVEISNGKLSITKHE